MRLIDSISVMSIQRRKTDFPSLSYYHPLIKALMRSIYSSLDMKPLIICPLAVSTTLTHNNTYLINIFFGLVCRVGC